MNNRHISAYKYVAIFLIIFVHVGVFFLFKISGPQVNDSALSISNRVSFSLTFQENDAKSLASIDVVKNIQNNDAISTSTQIDTNHSVMLAPVVHSMPSNVETILSTVNFPTEFVNNTTNIVERAKRDIGNIDKELHGHAVIDSSERSTSLGARLEQGISNAYVGQSDDRIDHYTSPDGVIYTRIFHKGKASCYMSGTVNFVPGILQDGSVAKRVNCPPKNSGWSK